MTFELGVYSFGNTPGTADGGYGPSAQAIRNVLEAVHLAEEVGLDFFGFGEHHTPSMPLSSPTALVNAAAASTERIKLGTTVATSGTRSATRPTPPTSPSPSTDSSPTTTARPSPYTSTTNCACSKPAPPRSAVQAWRHLTWLSTLSRAARCFAGGPDEISDRILHLHQLLGHTRQILQMDVGGMPHAAYLKAIELLGTEVLPLIRKEIA